MSTLNESPRKVIIFDHLDPESAAMALALYSRAPKSIEIHLKKIEEVGPGKFMAQYYVGYGHQSIGDCGSTTICIELVSMLNAKAIQNNELYNGQESSTRYLDMTVTGVLNPLGTKIGQDIQETWMSLYTETLSGLIIHLKEKYPALPEDNLEVYEKAIKAKAFDIARSLLPAGCLTFVGWHTTLRKAWDHTRDMLYFPLSEVSETGEVILSELKQKYPNSFNFKITPDQDYYYRKCREVLYKNLWLEKSFGFKSTIDTEMLYNEPNNVIDLLETRPKGAELPRWFNRYGQIRFNFELDFGSYRDIQRQRSCTQILPLLTTDLGFHSWYIEQIPGVLRNKVWNTIHTLFPQINQIEDPYIKQYYIPMGYKVMCELTGGLPSMVYIAELRSGQTVHPTLRPIAQKMGKTIQEILPDMALHVNYDPDEWSTRRGKQDIVKK